VDWQAQVKEEHWFWILPYLDGYYSLAQHAVDGDDLPTLTES
jgi:hypothetical protein